jgi:acyl carrier protein
MDEIYAQLTKIFHEVFDDDTIVLAPQMTAKDVREWDSLSHIKLVLAVQKKFGVKFSAAQTANLNNVGEFVQLIGAKTAAG